jgi:hypothetical protein
VVAIVDMQRLAISPVGLQPGQHAVGDEAGQHLRLPGPRQREVRDRVGGLRRADHAREQSRLRPVPRAGALPRVAPGRFRVSRRFRAPGRFRVSRRFRAPGP